MSNSTLKKIISDLPTEDKRIFTDGLQYEYADNDERKFWELSRRAGLVSRLQELLPSRRNSFDEEMKYMENISLAVTGVGIMSTGEIPEKAISATSNKDLIGFYIARGVCFYQDLPDDEIFPDDILYGIYVGCINDGLKCLKRFQPELDWLSNDITKSTPIELRDGGSGFFFPWTMNIGAGKRGILYH
jgi:hypothetical protein